MDFQEEMILDGTINKNKITLVIEGYKVLVDSFYLICILQ